MRKFRNILRPKPGKKRDEASDGTESGAADNHVALRPSVGQPSSEPSEQRVPRSSSSPGPTGRETVVATSLPNLRTLTLVAAPRGSPAVDIIFVHGFGGSSHATWAKDSTPELFWPGEWLPKERAMEKARIFTYGYNADWLSTEANNQTIGNFAMDLLALMARSRNNDTGESHEIGSMPILFVAHSMGGLVVKKAYIDALNAQSNPKYLRIGSSVNSMIFLSTPHIGSDAAPLLGKLISVSVVISDTQFRHSLERNSETLETINEGFRHHTGKLFLASFWETLETPLFAQLSRKFPGKVQVVDKGSARLMCTGEMYMSLQADHHGVCKYTSRQDSNYLKVLNTIRDALEASESLEKAYKVTHHIPLRPNKRFVGRNAELAQVQDLFADNPNQMLAIHGLGGTGKTQIALQFAYWVKENDPQCSVFWVSAMSKATFTQDCSHIASKLSILSDQNKDKDVKDLVKEYLSSETAGRWLLIVDNVDDANIFSPSPDQSMHLVHFLPESPNGQVLCTTRFRHIATDLGCSEIIQLNQMSKEDSLDFLRKSLSEEKLLCDASITDQLLTELELIPLAIAQAAAYIARNSVSISEYLELLRNTHEDMSELMSAEFTDLTRPQSTSNAIANTWILSFERIRQTDQTAADLLAFVSYIEPKAIPRSILPPPPSKTRLVSAIGTLLGYAFFTKRDDNTYDMHRLVQKATKIWLDKHPLVKEEARKEAVEHLADVFPDAQDSYDNIPMCREYLPHALKIAQSAQGEDLDSHYTLCELLGHFFIWDGRLQECIYWREQVFKWRKEMSGEDDAATLDSEFDLACACSRDGRIGRAIKLLEHVVAIQSKMLREDHSDRLGSEHELASAYLADGRIGEAIKLLAQVVAIRSKVVREDHSDRLGSEYELARAHLADGRIGEAIELFERVVAIRSKVVREDHPNYLASQHELANAYLADGRIGEAIKLLAQVVAIRSKVVREDHSDRLGSEHELARAHLANGFIGEAIELFERVVAIRSKVLREDHPNYLASRHELARAYFADGRIGEAIELLEPVVAIQSKMLQEDHSDRLGSEHVLATAYFKDGRVDEAIELMEHVVSIQRTSLLSGHPHREGSEAWLAYMHSGADITRELPWHDEMSSSFSSPPKPPPLRLDEAPPSSTTPVIQANNSPDHGPEAPEPAQKT